MALRITSASTPIRVERLNVCIYGQPGVGKTTLAFTADAPLLLDFDRGSYRAANRRDVVQVERWEDVANITRGDLEGYRTVVVDTAGRALDCLTQDIIRRDAKMGRGGVLSLQGYGRLKGDFSAWLKLLNGFGVDVVLIAHMDEQRSGDDIVERLDVQGGSKGEIYKAADAMGRIKVHAGQRTLLFDPSDASFGKNPGQLAPLALPPADRIDGFLAKVVADIKARLNTLTAEQAQAAKDLAEWQRRVAGFSGAEDFNAALPDAKAAPSHVAPMLRSLFRDAAKARGVVLDERTGLFVERGAA